MAHGTITGGADSSTGGHLMNIAHDPVRHAARQLAEMGEKRDKILAHISKDEAVLLAKLSGGSVNPMTGLPQFGFFSSFAGPISGILGGNSGSSSPGQSQYDEVSKATKPLTNEAGQLLNQYSTGTLSPGDQLSLNAQTEAAKAEANQYAASAGTGTSSMLANQLGNIDINSAEARTNILKGYLGEANQLYGTAFGPYEAALSDQFQGQQQAQSLLAGGIGSLFSDLGGVSGIGGDFSSLFKGIGGMFGGSSSPATSAVTQTA